jgi:nitrile hydratase
VESLGSGSGRVLREEMPAEDYLRASYYERWAWSTEQRLLRSGTIAPGEVDAWIARLRRGEEPPYRQDRDQTERVLESLGRTAGLAASEQTRFSPGDRVRVRRMRPAGHTRCPRYVRGATGTVEHVRGSDAFPDTGPAQGQREPVYAVAFASDELFGATDERAWTVVLDLYESYLERA